MNLKEEYYKIICGENDFEKDNYVSEYIKKNEYNHFIQKYNFSSIKKESFLDNFNNINMFSEFSIYIVKVCLNDLSEGDYEYIEKCIEHANEYYKLLLVFDKVDKRKSFFKNKTLTEFNNLQPDDLFNWILNKVEEDQLIIDRNVIEFIIENIGVNQYDLYTEIEKIKLCYKKSKNKNVSQIAISEICFLNSKIGTLDLVNAIIKKDKEKAIFLLKKLTANDETLYKIIPTIHSFLKSLLTINDLKKEVKNYNDIAKISGIHPFVVKQNMYNKFTIEELKSIIDKFAQLDFKIKTGTNIDNLDLEFIILGL